MPGPLRVDTHPGTPTSARRPIEGVAISSDSLVSESIAHRWPTESVPKLEEHRVATPGMTRASLRGVSGIRPGAPETSRQRTTGFADSRPRRARPPPWGMVVVVLVTAMAVTSATGSWTVFAGTAGATAPSSAAAVATATPPASPTGPEGASSATLGGAPTSQHLLPDSLVAPRVVPLNLPGPRPASWGPEDTPPGVPAFSPGSSDPVTPCDVVDPALG